MSDTFECPECNEVHNIAELELWEVYESEGKETEVNCIACDADIIITPKVTCWEFETKLNE